MPFINHRKWIWGTRFALLLCVFSVSAPYLWADEIHIVEQKVIPDTGNTYQVAIKFAVGNNPEGGVWKEQQCVTLSLPSKEGTEKPGKGMLVQNCIVNRDSSIVVLNYSPPAKRHATNLMLSPKPRTVILVDEMNARIAALCARQNKSIVEDSIWVERIDGNLLIAHSETKTGERHTLTVRATVSGFADKLTSPAEGALGFALTLDTATKSMVALQLVKFDQTDVPAPPKFTFPKLP